MGSYCPPSKAFREFQVLSVKQLYFIVHRLLFLRRYSVTILSLKFPSFAYILHLRYFEALHDELLQICKYRDKGRQAPETPFCFDDDDDDGPANGGVRLASAPQAEPDIFDESIEDMIEESRRDVHGSGKAPTSSYHGNNEMDDLFVSREERVQNAELSHDTDVLIKSEESDDDFDLMIIDQGEASSKAREE